MNRYPPVSFIQERRLFETASVILPGVSAENRPPIASGLVNPLTVVDEVSHAPSFDQTNRAVSGDMPVRDPQHYANVTSLATAVGNGVSAKFLDMPSGRRNMLAVRNTSATANIYIEFGKDASTNSVFRITPNGVILFDAVVPQDDLYVIGDAVNATISYSYSNITN